MTFGRWKRAAQILARRLRLESDRRMAERARAREREEALERSRAAEKAAREKAEGTIQAVREVIDPPVGGCPGAADGKHKVRRRPPELGGTACVRCAAVMDCPHARMVWCGWEHAWGENLVCCDCQEVLAEGRDLGMMTPGELFAWKQDFYHRFRNSEVLTLSRGGPAYK